MTIEPLYGMTIPMNTRAFGAEPCDKTDVSSPCFDPWALIEDDPQSPGPDVGGGPGVDCTPSGDPLSECYDPMLPFPQDPQSPGPDVFPDPSDTTDPRFQEKFPPLSRNWLDDALNTAAKVGGSILDALDGEGGSSGGGSGSGSGGGGNGAGSGENGEMTDQTKMLLLAGAGVLILSGVLK